MKVRQLVPSIALHPNELNVKMSKRVQRVSYTFLDFTSRPTCTNFLVVTVLENSPQKSNLCGLGFFYNGITTLVVRYYKKVLK